jgi:hypothetical protein
MITKQQRLDYLHRMKRFCQLLESEPPPRVCSLLDCWYLICPPQTPEFEDVQAMSLDLKEPEGPEERDAGWSFGGLIWESGYSNVDRFEETVPHWEFFIPKQYQSVEQALQELPEIARQFEAMVDAAIAEEEQKDERQTTARSPDHC